MGDLDAFKIMLDEFKRQKYEPRAAYLVGGLAASPYMLRESYTQPVYEGKNLPGWDPRGCTDSDCIVFNQWMGDLPWSADMPYAGQRNWSAFSDRYGDAGNGEHGVDRRWSRYMGGAREFSEYARDWLKTNGQPLPVNHYHAKAAATLLMLQIAVENRGVGPVDWFLPNLKQEDVNGVETFWGRLKLRSNGFNDGFVMGVGQFQGHEAVPQLVGPAPQLCCSDDACVAHSGKRRCTAAVYPAVWPCEVDDTCDITRKKGWDEWCVAAAVVACLAARHPMPGWRGRAPVLVST